MNRYEDPTQRLHSHGWSEEYKENYERIFGHKETWLERREREAKKVVLKISYLNGDVINKVFATQADADLYLEQYKADIVNWMYLKNDNSSS